MAGKKVNWKRDWKVGERKRVPGFDGIDAYRTKKYMPNGEPVMSFRYHIEGQKPVAVGKSSEGITLEDVAILRMDHIKKMRFGDTLPDYSRTRKGPMTLQEGWDKYIEHQAKVFPKTVGNFKSIWKNRMQEAFGSRLVNEIKHTDIQEHLHHLSEQGYANGSVNAVLVIFSNIYKYLIGEGDHRGGNPATNAHRLKDVKRERYIPFDEVGPFLEYVHEYASPKVELQINLMLRMGLRRSEVRGVDHLRGTYGLRWENIDFINNTMTFKRKGGEMDTMPIPQTIRDMLVAYGPKKSGWVFGGVALKPINKLIADFGFNTPDKLVLNGHERITMHSLRHTYCTMLGKASGNPIAMQHLMNHKDQKTTARYTHDVPDDQREAMDQLDGYIDNLVTPTEKKVIPLVSTYR